MASSSYSSRDGYEVNDPFPTWHVDATSRLQAEIVIEGQSVSSILSKINKQISILYRKVTDDDSNNSEKNNKRVNDLISNAMSPFAKRLDVAEGNLQSLEIQIKELALLFENQSSMQYTSSGVIDNEKFANMESTIESLLQKMNESDARHSEDIKNVSQKASFKFDKMEKLISELNNKIEALDEEKEVSKRMMQDQSLKIEDFAERINILTTKLQEKDELVEELNSKLSENSLSIIDLATKVHYLDEMRACHEVKIKNLEEDIFAAMSTVTENKKSIEGVIEPRINDLFSQLKKFGDVKADRAELNLKADLQLLNLKANVEDLRICTDEVIDNQSKTTSQFVMTAEAFRSLETRFDKKLELLLAGVFTQMKKEMKNERDSKEGTDIGRIRCLVCDQFVSQKGTAADGDTGGKFNPTMKHLVSNPDANALHHTTTTTDYRVRPHSSTAPLLPSNNNNNNNHHTEESKASPPRHRGGSPPRSSSPPKNGPNDSEDRFLERELNQYGFQSHNQLDPQNLLPTLSNAVVNAVDSTLTRGAAKKGSNLARNRAIHVDDNNNNNIMSDELTSKLPISSLQYSASDKSFPKRDYFVLSKSAVNPFLSVGPNTDVVNVTSTALILNNNSSNNNINNVAIGGGGGGDKNNRPGSAPSKRAVQGKLQAMGRPV